MPLKALEEPWMGELRLGLPCRAFLALAARSYLCGGVIVVDLFTPRLSWNVKRGIFI